MKMRYLTSSLAGLVPALLFAAAQAGATPPQWAHATTSVGARTSWGAAMALANARNAGATPLGLPGLKVTAGDWTAGDLYGYSATLSSNTAFVGAPLSTIGGNVNEGAVYVYRKIDGAWTQVQKIVPDDGGAYDEFGISIAVSGNTLLVGAAGHGGTGAAYVFVPRGGNWSQTQEFTASDAFGFGYTVALNGDNAVIGAPGVNSFAGAAYVFTRTNGAWSQTAELTANNGAAGGWFGQSVGVSGATILVGESNPKIYPAPQGAVYVFTRSDGAWTRTQKLTASDGGVGDGFGLALAVSGSTALIGAPNEQVGTFNFGAAYVFNDVGGSWSQGQRLAGSNATGPNQFGNSVTLLGSTAVVGVPVASYSGFLSREGAVEVFTKSGGGAWNLKDVITAEDSSPGQLFGFAVGVSANGALATSVPDYGGGSGPDAAYLFGPIDLGASTSSP